MAVTDTPMVKICRFVYGPTSKISETMGGKFRLRWQRSERGAMVDIM